MASAVLVNRKDADWPPHHRGGAAGAGFMGKVPFANPNPKPNPSKGPKRSQFPFHAPSSGLSAGHYNNNNINGCQIDESPAVTQTASDDASSINHHRRSGGGGGGRGEIGLGNSQYVSFSLRSYSRKELGELKNRLVSELDRIRQLQRRIESGELNHHQPPPAKIKKPVPTKKLSGSKRPFPVNPTQPPKDPAPISKRSHFENPNLMKNCGQLMTKLMKHKHAWVFNKPVDVVGMGLHDYYDIIKRPMDLGSVKTNLSKNLYSSVSDFACDVRLTFQNAMAYNPKGHEVHVMAEQLLSRFEELFGPLGERLASDRAHDSQASSWDHVEPERPVKKREEKRPEPALRAPPPPPAPAPAALVHAPASSSNPIPNSPPLAQSPVRTPSPPMRALPVKPLKQPKPKAKDPNKREMNMEEKHKLGVGLQSLPQEKMEQVVQIIKKRNGHLKQDGDEIELDIEAVDTETLWELDRLVTNYKKMVSKVKRQALMTNLNPNNVTPTKPNVRELAVSEKMEFTGTTTTTMPEPKRAKKGEAGDEDVDIGDDLPVSSFPPVEIEKDEKDVGVGGGGGGGGHASSSSSSGSSSSSSDSSSSNDSDSGSSSGSDSDDDNAHS